MVLSHGGVTVWQFVRTRGFVAVLHMALPVVGLPAFACGRLRQGCVHWSRYGAGAGFFFRNIDGLARHFRVHAVDLLGTGMSGKPSSRTWCLFPIQTASARTGGFSSFSTRAGLPPSSSVCSCFVQRA